VADAHVRRNSSLAGGNNVRLARRIGAVLAMFAGAAFGAVVIRYSIAAALGLAAAISAVQCGIVSVATQSDER
jgi:hypothetical protein